MLKGPRHRSFITVTAMTALLSFDLVQTCRAEALPAEDRVVLDKKDWMRLTGEEQAELGHSKEKQAVLIKALQHDALCALIKGIADSDLKTFVESFSSDALATRLNLPRSVAELIIVHALEEKCLPTPIS